jgi:DNA (cytosine-5)-methyltransferase 1
MNRPFFYQMTTLENATTHEGEGVSERRPIAIDLFAGAGGLSLGFERAGFDILASVEYDPVHAAVHAFNFPRTSVLCRDASLITSSELRDAAVDGWKAHHGPETPFPSEIDVVFGGPPCQGFSTIGKRLIDDSRNSLVFHFFRLVTELRPRYFVMENVPGMRLGGHSGILQRLIDEFTEAGYTVASDPKVLNAADYGVPQDRRRVFVLGWRKELPSLSYPRALTRAVAKRATDSPDRDAQLDAMSLPLGPTVGDAIGDLPNLDEFAELLKSDATILSEAQLARMESAASPYARKLRELDDDPKNLSHPRKWNRAELTSSMRTVHTEISISRFEATEPGETEPISRFYRLPLHGLCNTLRAGTGSERGAYTSPRPVHPRFPRVISVREAARLHSFPDWFRLHETKWHGFRQVGNAVPPLLGAAVAKEVAVALKVTPKKPTEVVTLGDTTLLGLSMAEAAEHFSADKSEIPKPRQRAAAG